MGMNLTKNTCRHLILYGLLFLFTATLAAAQSHPLAPPDTSSPRETLQSFLEIMRDSRTLLEKDPYLESKENQVQDELLEEQVEFLFDFGNVPVERIEDMANYERPLLMEILDRIELPPEGEIPDADAVKADNLTHWTIPHTEITLIMIEEGARRGQWVFSINTAKNLRRYYERVKDLPYRPDAVMGYIEPYGGPFQRLILLPEETFPDRWLQHLPAWFKTVYFDNPVWKWMAVSLVLLIGTALLALVGVFNRWVNKRKGVHKIGHKWLGLLVPVSGALFAHQAEEIIDEQISAVGYLDLVCETGLWAIALIFWGWAIIELGGIVSRIFFRFWDRGPGDVHHYLTSIGIRITSIVMAGWIVIYGIERLGLSIMPLLAGLGVGGIAIALAVRPTLENMIGGMILFIDKPVGVGDFCRFNNPGGNQIGMVETIGLRSTRLRMREDTIVTIPNSEFSQLQLENLSIRERTLMRATLALRYETTADQLRYVLAQLRKMMIGHPEVSAERLWVRFKGFGDFSLDIDFFAYIRTASYREYRAIREDINLRIMDIVKDAGTGFAFPSQTAYLANDGGLDSEQTRRAEEQVTGWRSDGSLPFPEFEQLEEQQFADTLDYPPAGAPVSQTDDLYSDDEQIQKGNASGVRSKKTKNWKWKRNRRP